MTVYVVEQGCYSDREVVGVFSSEEKAIRFCALHNKADDSSDACEYSAFELDEWGADGDITPVWVYQAYQWTLDKWHVAFKQVLSTKEIQKLPKYESCFWIILKSRDDEKAKKIMYDKLAERKAREAGI